MASDNAEEGVKARKGYRISRIDGPQHPLPTGLNVNFPRTTQGNRGTWLNPVGDGGGQRQHSGGLGTRWQRDDSRRGRADVGRGGRDRHYSDYNARGDRRKNAGGGGGDPTRRGSHSRFTASTDATGAARLGGGQHQDAPHHPGIRNPEEDPVSWSTPKRSGNEKATHDVTRNIPYKVDLPLMGALSLHDPEDHRPHEKFEDEPRSAQTDAWASPRRSHRAPDYGTEPTKKPSEAADPVGVAPDRTEHTRSRLKDVDSRDEDVGRKGAARSVDVDRRAGYVRGTCTSMCPSGETQERQQEGTLSVFEATEATQHLHFRQRRADPAKTVKKYRRSGVGRDMNRPEQLRTLPTLGSTACYLVRDVFARACAEDGRPACERRGAGRGAISTMAKAYVFVEDRLRAVRQDLAVQGLGGTLEGVGVLKTAANFYIVAGYLMSDQPRDVFDEHLHARELEGVLTSLAEAYLETMDVGSQQPCDEPSGQDEYLCLQAVHALATILSNRSDRDAPLAESLGAQGASRVLGASMAKLYALVPSTYATLPRTPSGRVVGMSCRAVGEHGNFCEAFPKMGLAVRVLAAVSAGNWTEFFRIVGRTSSGHAGSRGGLLVGGQGTDSPFALRIRCLCHAMLVPLRAHALRALNRSLGKRERVPVSYLQETLRMASEERVAGLCRALSLPIEGGSVEFKSVPAVWRNPAARRTGFLACDLDVDGADKDARGPCHEHVGPAREDGWVGLEGAWLGSSSARDGTNSAPCRLCAGYGCVSCRDPWLMERRQASRGLWEAVLAPS